MKVGIYGAGAIGGYLGVLLSSQGLPVVMLGRQSLLALEGTLQSRNIAGKLYNPGGDLRLTTDPRELADVDICLVSVKSRHTEQAAQTLAPLLAPGTPVCSLQNGLRNGRLLRAGGLEGARAGMVGFNVFRQDGVFVQATSGPTTIDSRPGPHLERLERLKSALEATGEEVELRADIEAVQAGKLLLNLNNGICAMAGVSVAASLRSRLLRRSFAACIKEGMAVYKAAGIPTVRVGKLAPGLIVPLLALPNAIVLRVAPSLVAIDEAARSSTLQDLEAGKPTEVDALNGELVALAQQAGCAAPVNAWVVREIRRLESAGLPVPFLTPEAIWDGVQEARRGRR